MPVKVCAISFFSPNLHPPPSFLKNLHMARQFELASLTETQMTSDRNVRLFDFHPQVLRKTVTAARLWGDADTEFLCAGGYTGDHLRQKGAPLGTRRKVFWLN